jgi:hypothetical protein
VDAENLPGRALNCDIAASKVVESDLTNLIERRHNQRVEAEGERLEEELWQESVRKHNEKRRVQARREWHSHHTSQAERLRRTREDLVRFHEEQAEELVADLPEPAA